MPHLNSKNSILVWAMGFFTQLAQQCPESRARSSQRSDGSMENENFMEALILQIKLSASSTNHYTDQKPDPGPSEQPK